MSSYITQVIFGKPHNSQIKHNAEVNTHKSEMIFLDRKTTQIAILLLVDFDFVLSVPPTTV